MSTLAERIEAKPVTRNRKRKLNGKEQFALV